MRGKKYTSRNEVITTETTAYFESNDSDFYAHGIDALPDRMRRVIKLEGEYLQK